VTFVTAFKESGTGKGDQPGDGIGGVRGFPDARQIVSGCPERPPKYSHSKV